ncbi:cupin domain-containing protein [Terrabacter sp. MAHUQ-38]|uniref:cupin domain-containing protein n=1 Tax=unclassified Terrabacter TaxID=2630222 RepID=UPI00165D8D79|nr:cupin domain-containing protein [Terrabacter sp. MAHUQ-38]MBC9823775.1 cupin-like domain-containing protein [Terrabacter sp. MAHUQ-38]
MTAGTTGRASTQRRGRSALRRLVPVDAETFARDHWGRAPHLTRADDLPGGILDLFGEDSVDELVSRRGLRAPFVRVARDGRTLGDREFTQGGGVGATVGDQVSDDKLLRLFADGSTIVLQGLHRTWGPLIDFTQQLAEELGHPVQANAYVTPSQSTGFSDHYDVHDVFVLQMGGEKRWRLHPPVHTAPLRDEPWTDHRAEVEEAARQPPEHELTLHPGDVLYLPRGWVHSATALGGVSIHVTLGIHVWTRRHVADELVTIALATASRDERVRASLDVTPSGFDRNALVPDVEIVREALVQAMREVEPDDVVDALEIRARGAQRPSPISPLAQVAAAEALTPDTSLRLRPHVAARLVQDAAGSVTLHSRIADLAVEPHDVGTLVALLDDGVLRADMVGMELARRLMLAGLLVVAAD